MYLVISGFRVEDNRSRATSMAISCMCESKPMPSRFCFKMYPDLSFLKFAIPSVQLSDVVTKHCCTWACRDQVDVPEGSGVAKVRVNVKHDIHGMFNVQSAEMMKEVVKVRFTLKLAWNLAISMYRILRKCWQG